MTKRTVKRKPRPPKRAAKAPEKPRPISRDDVTVLASYITNAREYANGARGDIVALLDALQGDRDSDELILKALAALAGDVEAAHSDVLGADREMTKLMVRIRSLTGDTVQS